MILAIGYRVRSNIGTNFRKWATSTLKEYVTKGFALNDDLLKEAGGRRYVAWNRRMRKTARTVV